MDHAQVLIIGAGVTGLVIAHGLQQAGISYLIFESEESEERRPKEWTMGLVEVHGLINVPFSNSSEDSLESPIT